MVVDAINAVVFAISLKTFFRVKICAALSGGVWAPPIAHYGPCFKGSWKTIVGAICICLKKFKAPSTAK